MTELQARPWPRSATAGLYKHERQLTSPQSAHIDCRRRGRCSTSAPTTTSAWPTTRGARPPPSRRWTSGASGMASVRFICGTQTQHASSSAGCRSSSAPRTTILYSSCFDANGGVFETLFGAEDAIISDELNHASIIDGIRLSKARRLRYRNRDMADLRAQLKAAPDARRTGRSSPTACSRWTATSPRWTRSATWPTSTARWSWSTTPTRSASSASTAAARPSCSASLDRVDIYHRHARQGAGRRLRRLRRPRAPRSSTCCASGRGPTCSPTRVAPAVVAGSLAALDLVESGGRACARTLRANAALFRRADDRGGLRPAARRAPDHPGDVRRRRAGRPDRRRDARSRAST